MRGRQPGDCLVVAARGGPGFDEAGFFREEVVEGGVAAAEGVGGTGVPVDGEGFWFEVCEWRGG